MRCLALAEELRESGATVSFVCRSHPGNLNNLIREKGFECHELPEAEAVKTIPEALREPRSVYASWLGVSQRMDAEGTIEKLGEAKPEWIIVDHYGLDADWEKTLRPYVEKIMVIDDLADRRHDCDLLLDQNLFLDGKKRYDGLIPPSCTRLIGPQYALLRKEFREARKNLRKRSGDINRILVFLGGADPDNITGIAIEALSSPELLHLQVDVVIGSQNPHKETIEKIVQARPQTKLHVQATNMAELMSQADLAIGAGGSTVWERLCLGLPSVVIPLADNQSISTAYLFKKGVLAGIEKKGFSVHEKDQLKNVILRLVKYPEETARMSVEGLALAILHEEGRIASLLGKGAEDHLSFRRATLDDCALYWSWANDPEVRLNAFNSEPISWDAHQEWFAARLNDPNSILLIYESQYGPVGQIRLDGGKTQRTISYSVARQYRGKGIGKKIISEVIAVSPPLSKRFLAEVKTENLASANIFEKLGFQRTELLVKNAYSFTLDLGDTYQAA